MRYHLCGSLGLAIGTVVAIGCSSAGNHRPGQRGDPGMGGTGGAAGETAPPYGGTGGSGGVGGGAPPAGGSGGTPAPPEGSGPDARADAPPAADSGATGAGGAAAAGSTVCINADGPEGQETYALLDSFLGANCIENPDNDHTPSFKHVKEELDPEVGPCFAVHVHKEDSDIGRDTGKNRVEIKVNGGAADALKATEGKTMTYTWRFKMAADMVFSPRFNAMMQMKSFGGNAGLPLLNIKVQPGGGPERLLVEYIGDGGGQVRTLGSAPIEGLKGVWLQVFLRAEIKNNGSVFMTIKKPDGTAVISIDEKALDMWRQGEYQRLKLGLYRGKADSNRPLEIVRFASIGITPGPTPTSDCTTK